MAIEPLTLRCPACGTEFKSEFELDPKTMDIDAFIGNSMPCSNCGAEVVLTEESMVFQES